MISELTNIIKESLKNHNNIWIYYVWWTVRDTLLNIIPHDIDMAWNLTSDEFISIFWWNFSVKFWTVFTNINDYIIEYTPLQWDLYNDSIRRDFTINSIYYDIINNEYIDYNDWINDLNNWIIRLLWKNDKNIIDDPIRILRAIRLKHKFWFKIDDITFSYLVNNSHLLNNKSLNFRKSKEISNIINQIQDYNIICDELYNHKIYIDYHFKNKMNNLIDIINYYNNNYNIDLSSLYKLLFVLYTVDFDLLNILNFNLSDINNDFNIDSNKINLSLLRNLLKDLNGWRSWLMYKMISNLKNDDYNKTLFLISKKFRIQTRYDLKFIIIVFAIIEWKTNNIEIERLLTNINTLKYVLYTEFDALVDKNIYNNKDYDIIAIYMDNLRNENYNKLL